MKEFKLFSESHPLIRNFFRFLALPYCYFKLVNWKECTSSRYQVIKDLLYIFFYFKYYPDNYTPCRFWEKDRNDWQFYYGSSYHPYQRHKLRKEVQTYERQIVFNDKVICDQLCRGIDVKMPRSFGVVDPSDDYKIKLKKIFMDAGVDSLILKPILGHAGRGIVVALKKNTEIIIKTATSEASLNDFVLKEASIVQEMVTQHDEIAKINSNSVNTIRVVTLFTKSYEVIPISSSIRFGVGNAFVDNWSAGGIALGVDHKSGKLKEIAFDKYGNQYREHPDSKFQFKDFQIPGWGEIIKVAVNVQKACFFYRLLGMDIALSKEDPILIEVNANPDIVFQEQTSGPLLRDKTVLNEFARYDLLINHFQKDLLKRDDVF